MGGGWDWGTSVLIGLLFKQSAFFCSNPCFFLLEVNDIKFISIIVHEQETKIGIWLWGVEKNII